LIWFQCAWYEEDVTLDQRAKENETNSTNGGMTIQHQMEGRNLPTMKKLETISCQKLMIDQNTTN
jgi:hypothetical protein